MGITALFSDTEGFENNSFMAGTLNLKIDWREYYFNGIRNLPDDRDTDVQILDNWDDLAEFLQRTTAEEFDGPADDPPDSAIKLDEVKPGEFGEFTLRYDIAGNPGHAQLETDEPADGHNGLTEIKKTVAVIPLEVPGKATSSVRREPRTRRSCSTTRAGARPTSMGVAT